MIWQHPSALSIRDRDIAAMLIAVEAPRGEHWIMSLLLWIAIVLCAVMFWVALV
jgi:hypothetical protein